MLTAFRPLCQTARENGGGPWPVEVSALATDGALRGVVVVSNKPLLHVRRRSAESLAIGSEHYDTQSNLSSGCFRPSDNWL